MSKTDIINKLFTAVTEETEITADEILSDSRATEVVDARAILVNLLSEKGFYPSQIARYIRKTPSTVHNLLRDYNNRIASNKIITIYVANISKQINNN